MFTELSKDMNLGISQGLCYLPFSISYPVDGMGRSIFRYLLFPPVFVSGVKYQLGSTGL